VAGPLGPRHRPHLPEHHPLCAGELCDSSRS
jgi:hypothetical protein